MKFFNLVLSKFTFSGDISGYWMKRMTLQAITVTDQRVLPR